MNRADFLSRLRRLLRAPARPAVLGLLLVSGLVALTAAPAALAQDVDPPVIRILESGADLANGSLYARAVTPVVEVTDASPVTVDATLDGAAFTSGSTVSGEGSHLLTVSATDDAGNAATLTVGFEIDTVPPAFVALAPLDGFLTVAAEITLTGEVAGAAAVTVDGQPANLAGGTFSAGPFPLAEGARTFSVVASDAAGNSATRAHRVVRDSTPPQVALSQPAAGAVVGASPVDVVGTVSDPHLSAVTVNGTAAAVSGTTFVARNVPLAEGTTPLVAQATDAAGNSAQAQRTVVLDTQPPAVAITDPAAGTVTPVATLQVSGSATDPHLTRVEVDGIAAQLSGGTWSAAVPLTEGANTVTATAWDSLGLSATATVSVVRDSTAPEVRITTPADGVHLAVETVDVAGTVVDEADLAVTLNGTAATLGAASGGTAPWNLAAVPLVEGENRLIARVTDALGNQGTHTRLVYRDTVAPELLGAEPADGALAVAPSAVFELTFSETLAEPAPGAWRLELADGTPLAATATLAGDTLTVRPDADLPSLSELRLVLTAALADPAGNALVAPPTLAYTVADVEAPPPPVLASAPPTHLCSPRVTLSGTAEAEGTVRAAGGAAWAETRAAADGTFALQVELRPGALHRLELTVRDRDGNLSAVTAVEVVHDCAGPVVVAAERSGDVFTVTFDETVDPAGLGGADGIALHDDAGAVAGTVAAAGAATATFTPAAALAPGAVRLEVGSGVRDLAGNPLAFPFAQVFGADVAPSFLAGRALDAATGRPLAGARAVVLSTDGIPGAEPRPEQTTGADGRFRIPVTAGTHYLVVGAVGHTPVMRRVPATAGAGSDVFDPRLSRLAEAETVGTGGGTFGDPARRGEGPVLEVAPGALAADAPVSVTALGEQALPALLPYGWSPRGAAWVDLGGATLAAAVDLSFPVESPDGTALVVAALDTATLQWDVVAETTVFDGAVQVSADGEGAWVAVEADLGPPAPPAAVVGTVLASAPAPLGDEVTAAAVTFDPAVVLPSQASRTTVAYTLGADAASGLPVTVTIREELTLLDGSVRTEAPYDTDLLVFRAPDGTPRSTFLLRPSEQAARLPLQVGAEDVGVHRYAGDTLQGNVLGPLGGTVTNPEGDRVDLPAGALPEPTPVLLERLAEGDLPVAVPAGFAFLGHLELDLSGRALAVPATLTLELGAAPAPGEAGLLFQVVDLAGVQRLRPVAALAATATGWTTAAIDPLDLPWPGVRTAGRYLFARRTADLAFLRGGVYGVGGGLAPGLWVSAAVDGATVGWVQISNQAGDAAGRYVLPAPLGAAAVAATDPASGDAGAGAATLATADERVDLDLLLQLTGPQVVEMVPADGAIGVAPGIEPTVRFSEEVDAASLATGVLLYEGAQLVPVTVERQGTLVRVVPLATLRPATTYELRVTTALRDLQGHRIAQAVSSTFTVQAASTSDGLDRRRIHLFEPDGAGQARVLGRSGAVPAGSLVFVENTTSFVATPSVTAAADGSFDVTVSASLTDTLLLHVVIEGQNEVVWELTPFLTADGRGAHLGRGGTTFTTLDDVTVEVEEGTFLEPTRVRVEPRPAASPAPLPADFQVLAAFELDFGGAEAQKKLHVSLPTPAGLVGDEALLARIWRLAGADHWMLHDLMRRDGGQLTTRPPAEELAAAFGGSGAGVPSLSGLGSMRSAPQEGVGAPAFLAASARMGDRQEYLPGSANPGLYVVMESTSALDFVAFPFQAGSFAYFQQTGLDGLVAVVNAHIQRLLGFDAILLPVRRGQSYSVVGRDLDTGYRVFSQTFEAPAADSLTLLPPGLYGDAEEPFPVAGSPLRFFVLETGVPTTRELDGGMVLSLGADGVLAVTGSAGAADPQADLQVLGLDDARATAATAAVDGSFSIQLAVIPGNRYLLAVGATVDPRQALEIGFSEGIADPAAALDVTDSRDTSLRPRIEPVGSAQTLRISPEAGWTAGETYTLVLRPALADAAGNRWERRLDLRFQVAGSRTLDTFELPTVRAVESLGSLLFVAAGEEGLVVLDAADPGNLRNAIDGDLRFPFPLADPVTALAVDPHGRVLVAGGGVNGFGQLKIFDPQLFDPVAIAAAPSDPAVRYAAFRGSTVVSDSPTSGTSLPEGQPRRLAVLSDDDTAVWRLGVDDPPAGVSLTPAPLPAAGPITVTVGGGDGTPGQAVTLRDLTRGRWRRTDADGAGAWSVTLDAEVGDRLEVRRNRQTLAYLATLGVGIQVVDVNAFYGEAPEDWNAPAQVSDVVGTYTGFGDPTLRLCDEAVSDIGTSLVDLGTLFGDAAHPFTLVGLVAFRGLGMFESDPADVAAISFYGQTCARIGGSAQVFGLDVAEDYPIDLDGDGSIGDDELRDYVVVSHRTQGVLVFDATDRESVTLAGHVRLAGQAERVTVDRVRRRLFVSGAGGGLYVVDFDRPPSPNPLDLDGDGVDDRVLEVVTLPGNTNSQTFVFPELGLAWAGGLERGVTGLSVGEPRLALVRNALVSEAPADPVASSPRHRPVSRLAPLGVPTAAESGLAGAPDLPAAFRVLAALPGVVGDTVRLDLVSLGPGGQPMDGAGDPADLPGLPPPALTGADGLVLHRQASHPWEEGYQLFLSEEVVAVADLRAARDYDRTLLEAQQCTRCDGAALGIGAGARQILSGHRLAVRFPAALRATLAGTYDQRTLDRTEVEVPSVPWEISPSVRQEPALHASLGTGDVAPGTLLHSGEFSHRAEDLSVRGRAGFDFAFVRTYRSQTVGSGPLGPGWDHLYRQRLRELPTGDVEYYDGTGRRETFGAADGATGGHVSPPGVYAELAKIGSGWQLLAADGSRLRFDAHGRLVALEDAARDAADTGNQVRLRYDGRSRLVEITDSLDRQFALEYDAAGRLQTLRDFTGRQVGYAYDAAGRLVRVTSPVILTGEATFPSGLETEYAYRTAAGTLAERLHLRDDLSSFTDSKDQQWLTLSYGDEDGDGRPAEVTGQVWGGAGLSLAYDFATRTTTVTDRRSVARTYVHNPAGQATSIVDGALQTFAFEYDAAGRLKSRTLPKGRKTGYAYDASGEPRSAGNVVTVTETPDARGANGSGATRVTTITYDGRTNQPTRVEDPDGRITVIDRDDRGLPERITEGWGSPAAAVTVPVYDAHGRLAEVTDARGTVTRYAYFDGGASRGYLRQVTVDPSGEGLVTRYETDARGNVSAVIDPRGVRHTQTFNEVDWLVESVAAASPSVDGAPALGYRTTWLHDANGNVVEERRPWRDGTSQTATTLTYGPLDERLTARHVVQPSGQVVQTAWTYDPARQVETITDPGGRVTKVVYDGRGLPTEVHTGFGTAAVAVETLAYDDDHQLVSRTDPRSKTWTVAYDGYGRESLRTDPLGHQTRTSYPSHGADASVPYRDVVVEHLDASGQLLARTRTSLDTLARPATETRSLWEGTDAAAAVPVTSSFVYDGLGNLVATADPLGRVTDLAYDTAGRLVRRTDPLGNQLVLTLDPAGNAIRSESVEQGPGGPVTIAREARYDALGRPTAEIDALGNTWTTIYDARGNITAEVDPEDALTSRTFDSLDRLEVEARPEGLSVTYAYEPDSRLASLTDALGNTTTYRHDALGRRDRVTYPDGTAVTTVFDAAGYPTRVTDANGSVITQLFDDAGRLESRSVVQAPGVIGPSLESYTWDGLSRLTRAQSGTVVSDLAYDSLSRLRTDTTASRTLTHGYDAAGNLRSLVLPSAYHLGWDYDALNRPASVGERTGGFPGGTLSAAATYAYQGPARIAAKTAGGLSAESVFDAAGRRTAESVLSAAGLQAFGEQVAWSPRGLKSAQTRQDLGGRGWVWSYDQALRLTGAVADVDPTATVANNTAVASAEGLPSYTFQPDAAQNLLARSHQTVFGPTTEAFPLDASGRNRPATADGRPLEYDANGNLTRKGDRRFEYDFRNRLTRVTDDGTEIARYAYDAFDRRVEAVTAAGTEATVWSGWRPVETYRDGLLHSRRLYGAGLDEIVEQQTDLDGNGTLENVLTPWYDSTGNLALLATPSGQPLERYEYTPFGKRRIQADATAPEIEQLRAEPTRLVLVLSEEVRGDVLEEAVASGQIVVEDATTGNDREITIEFGEDWEGAGSTVELATAGPAPQAGATEPATQGALLVAEGTEATASAAAVAASTEEPGSITAPLQSISASRLQQRPRRVVLLNLTVPPPAGTSIRLRIEPEAVQDLFLNDLPTAYEQTFPWPTEATVVADTAPPTVDAINLLAGHLEVVFSEPPDPATAGALSVTDHTLTWTPSADGLGLVSDQPLGTGTFTLTVDTTLADLTGRLLAAQSLHELDIPLAADTRRLWEAPDPRDTATSTVANTFGYHGLPVDEATGLVYARHRVYDPELGRFLTADPLGYVDGPNLYQYGLNNPVSFSDPMGLYCMGIFGAADKVCSDYLPRFESGFWTRRREELAAATTDMSLTNRERIVASVKVNAQIPLYFMEVIGREIANVPHRVARNTEVAGELYAEAVVNAEGLERVSLLSEATGLTLLSAAEVGFALEGGGSSASFLTKRMTSRTPVATTTAWRGASRNYESLGGEFLDDGARMVDQPFGVPRATAGAESAFQGAQLRTHLRLQAEYGQAGVRELANGRFRYYGELRPPRTAGEMIGQRTVREWDSATGLERTWLETVDAAGNVRIVRPETGGPKVHHLFDAEGNYVGQR